MGKRLSSKERMLAAMTYGGLDYIPASFMIFYNLFEWCSDQKEFIRRQLELGLGYKIRKHYGFSIIHFSFLFSVSISIFALIYILIYGHPFYSKASLLIGAPIGACFALAIYFYQQVLEKANLNISWTVIQFSVLIPFFSIPELPCLS